MPRTSERAIASKQDISPAQRAAYFAQLTRQNYQTYPAMTVKPGGTLRFDLDKVRLSARVRLLIEATLTATKADGADFTPAVLAPFSLVKGNRVTTNMQFNPHYLESGIGAFLLMKARPNSGAIDPVYGPGTPSTLAEKRAINYMGKQTAAGGKANKVRFEIDYDFITNERDAIGFILTQNQETKVTVSLDFGQATDLITAAAGLTAALSDITVTPMVETYNVPPVDQAIPDLTIIKTTGEMNDLLTAGAGTLKLPTGGTYRRILFYLTKEDGTPVDDDELTAPFEIVVNTSDTPYRITPRQLSNIATERLGVVLPAGVWMWDWSYQGLVNYGGSRDYFDTERLTEFWVKAYHANKLNVKAVWEVLGQMGG